MNYKEYLTNLISSLGIDKDLIDISIPPKEGMGDYCLPCFKVKIDNFILSGFSSSFNPTSKIAECPYPTSKGTHCDLYVFSDTITNI